MTTTDPAGVAGSGLGLAAAFAPEVTERAAKARQRATFFARSRPEGPVAPQDEIRLRGIVMAGGEGTRFRPITTHVAKPLAPAGPDCPFGYALDLLNDAAIPRVTATVCYKGDMIRERFGDGRLYGVDLTYSDEGSSPLGTAGAVKKATQGRQDATLVVVSGDAVTDFQLRDLIAEHRRSGALVSLALARVPDPTDFGLVITNNRGEVEPDGFVEKPQPGDPIFERIPDSAFHVNTGIMVIDPLVLRMIPPGKKFDWSHDVYPRILKNFGGGIFGHLMPGSWIDIGNMQAYSQARRAVLEGKIVVRHRGQQLAANLWVHPHTPHHVLPPNPDLIAGNIDIGKDLLAGPDVRITGPAAIGDYAAFHEGSIAGPYTVVGDKVSVMPRVRLRNAVVYHRTRVDKSANYRFLLPHHLVTPTPEEQTSLRLR